MLVIRIWTFWHCVDEACMCAASMRNRCPCCFNCIQTCSRWTEHASTAVGCLHQPAAVGLNSTAVGCQHGCAVTTNWSDQVAPVYVMTVRYILSLCLHGGFITTPGRSGHEALSLSHAM